MKQTILVVEDDAMLRQLICIYLKESGYEAVEAADGEAAKDVYAAHQPLLVILDLMLPGLSGEEFCEWLRLEEQSNVPIIMISAKVRTDDKIYGLKIGADDYLTKPFDPEELIAHVEAVLRRAGHTRRQLMLDGLCMNPNKGEVMLFDETLELTKHEFSLLHHFMRHPNIVFSREELILQLYPHADKTVMDRTIDAHIKKLRAKIEVHPATPERIQTVRGMGYKFVTK